MLQNLYIPTNPPEIYSVIRVGRTRRCISAGLIWEIARKVFDREVAGEGEQIQIIKATGPGQIKVIASKR